MVQGLEAKSDDVLSVASHWTQRRTQLPYNGLGPCPLWLPTPFSPTTPALGPRCPSFPFSCSAPPAVLGNLKAFALIVSLPGTVFTEVSGHLSYSLSWLVGFLLRSPLLNEAYVEYHVKYCNMSLHVHTHIPDSF